MVKAKKFILITKIKKLKVCALVAVRMESKRLPNKAFLDLGGYTILERVAINLKASDYIDEVIIATTNEKSDDPIEEFSLDKRIPLYRGSKENVLERYWDAAKLYEADIVVRATGDNPFVCYEIADLLIKNHVSSNSDFTMVEKEKLPMGVATEIISRKALDFLLSQKMNFNYSEYMTFYFINNPKFFDISVVPSPIKFHSYNPRARLTIDYPKDYELAELIVKNISPGNSPIKLENILRLMLNKPEIIYINQGLGVKWLDQKKLVDKINFNTKIL